MKRLLNKLTHRNRRIITGGIVISLIGIIALGFAIIPQSTYGAAGPGEFHASKVGCASGPVKQYNDWCYGATWRFYKWGQKSKTFEGGKAKKPTAIVDGTKNTPGGKIRGCKDADGFFVLGMEKYKRTKGSGTGATKYTYSLGYQVGISRVDKMKLGGKKNGSNFIVVKARSGIKASYTWDQAEEAFKDAKKLGQTGNYTKFAGDLGWFCSNVPPPDKEEKEHKESSVEDFWSRSGIHIPKQNDDVEEHGWEWSDDNSNVTYKLSTNADHLTVDFAHKMYYGDKFWDKEHKGCQEQHDEYKDVASNWNVNWEGDGVGGTVASGELHTGGVAGNSDKEVSRTDSYTISLAPGETKKVCQVIGFNPASVSMEGVQQYRTERLSDGSTRQVETHMIWSPAGSSGNGESSSCVEITRPIIPSSDEDPSPGPTMPTGGASSDIFYAGETAEIGWDSEIKDNTMNHLTRRYTAFQAVAYNVSFTQPWYSDVTKGDKKYKGYDACAYYKERRHGVICEEIIGEEDVENQPTDTDYHRPSENPLQLTEGVVVPDDVGDKYCNGLGYKFEYWWGLEKNGVTEWHRDDDKTYWAVFNSKCRTIAKKPSTAIWNGSLITQGSVKASISERYTMPIMGATISSIDNDDQRTYGTWSEYLNVIGLNVKGVASGAAFAKGYGFNDDEQYSPLTISNDNPNALGQSHVLRNDAYLTRLNTFLRDNQKIGAQEINDINHINGSKGGTQVYHISGNTTLSHDLIYPGSTYYSVYDLPQTIIFVDGNLDIAPSVSRIDAWLIVNGTLNTCSNFQNKFTQAAPGFECINQLAVNGPVIANQLITKRSFGADPTGSAAGSGRFTASTREAPAEIFNLRQDAFLWAYAQAGRYDSSYTEVYSRELAPRY